MNIPNLLSLFRILTIPIIVSLLYFDWPQSKMIIAGLTALAWLSDMLDGVIAAKMENGN